MKKVFALAIVAFLTFSSVWAQNKNANTNKAPKSVQSMQNQEQKPEVKKLYDEEIDAQEQIQMALERAQKEGKFVICQVGGNWCPWCLRFADFITKDDEIRTLIEENFVYIHVNYSKQNPNLETMKQLKNPGRFGYPVLVVLDENGQVMHIQNSSYLEEEKSYNRKKVLEFFQNWTAKAIETIK